MSCLDLISRELNIWEDYVSRFDKDAPMIKRKYEHSKRVAEWCYKLKPNELSVLIGLYHDIARFPQYDTFGTYDDIKSFDHGVVGSRLVRTLLKGTELFDDNQEIVEKAIKYHNKYDVPKALPPIEKEYCDIIRDADKIDILTRVMLNSDCRIDKSVPLDVRPEVKEQFFRHELIHNEVFKERPRTYTEEAIVVLAFCYDLTHLQDFILDEINKSEFPEQYLPYVNEVKKHLGGTVL